MRKQTKWAVILGAAAVMTFGACMTSFAATGWIEEDGEWYYYNKDEEAVTEKWQKGANDQSYYLGSEGNMVISDWVEGEDTTYYVNSYGARCINEWRFMYGKDDESSEEESWFYFDANGKMSTKKKTVNGKTYYFDADGKMITGWLTYDGTTASSHEESAPTDNSYYVNENGERITGWIKLYTPEDLDEEEDQYWYNFKTDGKMRRNQKSTISNKTYLFNEKGEMLSGWVYADLTVGSEDIQNLDEDSDVTTTPLNAVENYYYAGGEDDGSIKKNVWVKAVPAGKDEKDADIDKEWYYTSKDGRLYYADAAGTTNIASTVTATATKGKKEDFGKRPIALTGDAGVVVGFKKIGSKTYAFDNKGEMIDGLVNLTAVGAGSSLNTGFYYFGKSDDGSMKTTTVTLVDDNEISHAYAFSADNKNGLIKGQGVTGVISSKLYADGLVVAAEEGKKYQPVYIETLVGTTPVDTWYIVNESGRVTTGIKSIVTNENGDKFRNGAKRSAGLLDARNTPSNPPISTDYYDLGNGPLEPSAGAPGYIVEEYSEYDPLTFLPDPDATTSKDIYWWVIDPSDCINP